MWLRHPTPNEKDRGIFVRGCPSHSPFSALAPNEKDRGIFVRGRPLPLPFFSVRAMPSPSMADHPLFNLQTKNPAPTIGTRRKPRGTTLVDLIELHARIVGPLGEGRVQPSVP